MKPDYDLGRERALIRARRTRHEAVMTRHAMFRADVERGIKYNAMTIARCEQSGHKNGRPKLAEVLQTPHGTLFISKIAWAPSDQLNLRPWEREHLLGVGLTDETFERYMTDDEALLEWLAHVDNWQDGHPASAPRWLGKREPFWIREVIDLPEIKGRSGLWTRCPMHLDAAYEFQPSQLMDSARQ